MIDIFKKDKEKNQQLLEIAKDYSELHDKMVNLTNRKIKYFEEARRGDLGKFSDELEAAIAYKNRVSELLETASIYNTRLQNL